MEPINWFMKVVTQHYFDFNGRARRAEYWWYFLVYIIGFVILAFISNMLHMGGLLGGLFGVALLLPSLGVLVRRLHDTGRSGWWYFIVLVPLVGGILLIVWLATEGTKGPNAYGPDPKA
jgi:uncharacterized membrane protein YhaH (DUF805 family)